MAGKLHLTYPPNIAKVKVMRRRTNVLGQGLWHIPFLFLYFFALRACVETSGNPYEVALAHHKSKGYDPDALAKATAPAKPAVVDDWGGAAATAEDDRWGDLEADPDEPPARRRRRLTPPTTPRETSTTRSRTRPRPPSPRRGSPSSGPSPTSAVSPPPTSS